VSSRSPASSGSTPSADHSTATQPIPKKSQQIKTDKPRPHICTICTRAFARLEHLKRHERSHTNEKPFQCAACGRCFARRDLVLRHQQKLHSSLPNIMRRGSSKDLDEHVIVLHNNTENTAPLPNGATPDLGDANTNDAFDDPEKMAPSQLYSPPKSNEFNYNNGMTPQFRTGLFQNPGTSSNILPANNPIPSPIPTNSSQNSPPNVTLPSSITGPSGLQKTHIAQNIDSPRKKQNPVRMKQESKSIEEALRTSHLNHLLGSQTRHASFSAVSGSSYTNLKDAKNIQQINSSFFDSNGQLSDFSSQLNASDELTSKNLLLSGLDINSLGMMDWTNLDGLDLSSAADRTKGAGSPSFSQLTAKQRSIKNLQQFFLDNLAPSGHTLDNGNGNATNENALAALQFNNPNHPHHLKGMTPFEYGLNPPNYMNMTQNMFSNGHSAASPINLQTDAVESKKLMKKQRKEHEENPSKKARTDSTSSANITDQKIPLNSSNQPRFSATSNMHAINLNMTPDDDWLKEIINTPYDTNFPVASHQIGFIEAPSLLNSPKLDAQTATLPSSTTLEYNSINEISSLFRSRQIDLVKQMNPNVIQDKTDQEKQTLAPGDFEFTLDSSLLQDFNFITEDFRSKIISISNLNDTQFPTTEDLNHYMRLYELEFNKYFPFIHLPSLKNPMVNKFEYIPLILSMTSIGALYSYHDTNTLLLFSLSKYHIQNFFEKEITLNNLQFKKVPLMAHQCLVLHIFITLFFNETNMTDVTSKQMKSMIGLIKSTNFNEPLEQFLIPPQDLRKIELSQDSTQVIQKNFDYFIMAQSRIRTIHLFYMLQSFRASIGGLPIYCDHSLLKSGNHCANEDLWRCSTSADWFSVIKNGKFDSLVDLSNGQPFDKMLQYLRGNFTGRDVSMPLSFNNLLSLLMYAHECVQIQSLQSQPFNHLDWKLNHKPSLEKLVKCWEQKFIMNGGTLLIDATDRHLLNIHNELKIILPLYWLLKIKLVINITPVISPVFSKDWKMMNNNLDRITQDEPTFENLKQSLPFCIEIIELWTHNIKSISNDDMKQCSLRSPVFFVSCLFVAVLIMSSYLHYLESKIEKSSLNDCELIKWVECESITSKVEEVLSPILKSSYSEMLTKQGNTFKSVKQDDGLMKVKQLIETKGKCEGSQQMNQIEQEIRGEILNDKLSIKTLYLGIRILADAPVWPIAMGLSESLKFRANYLSEK
ncbi:uncharacterized protein CANTADRAFT_28795, partial [Suhomyces tanzawaensis NRRL Y-17324]